MIRARKVLGVREQYDDPGWPGRHPRLYSMLPTTLVPSSSLVEIPDEAGKVAASGHFVVVIGEPIERFTPPAQISQTRLRVTAGLSLFEPNWYREALGPRAPSHLLATATDSPNLIRQ
jgi:hypothetical protein